MAARAYNHNHDHDARSDSALSGLSLLGTDSDTDEFGRLIIQQAKDKQRVEDALRGNSQPFRRARTHPRVGLTLENLERNAESIERDGGVALGESAAGQRDSPASVSSSDRSNQPLRPPREWGRRGRRDRDWLRRITSPDTSREAGRDEELREEADVPVPSVEATPATLRHLSQDTPSKKSNASYSDWDLDDDLSMGSVIASTPAVPRNTILDDIRQRELDSVKERAAATTRRDRIPEASQQDGRPLSGSLTSLKSQTESVAPQLRERSGSDINLPKRPDRLRSKSSASSIQYMGPGEAMPGSPIVVYKSPPTGGVVDHDIQASAQSSQKENRHRRDHSHDLLRRLARASSNSPSPGKTTEKTAADTTAEKQKRPSSLAEGQEKQQREAGKTGGTRPLAEARHSAPGAPGIPTPPPESGKGAANDQFPKVPTHSPGSQPGEVDQEASTGSLVHVETPAPPKTPFVTGGWIDTPAAEKEKHRLPDPDNTPVPKSRPSSSGGTFKPKEATAPKDSAQQRSQERKPSKPDLPQSAVAGLVDKARGNDDGYGDSTIDSLEDLMATFRENNPDLDVEDDTMDSIQIPDERPDMSDAERNRREELLRIKGMNEHLRAARAGIRDTNRGVRHLESAIEAKTSTSPAADGKPQSRNSNSGPCLCNSAWAHFKHLFYNPHRVAVSPAVESSTRFTRFYSRLTWLGLALLVLWSWYLAETALCVAYCHPTTAPKMTGYGVNPSAPAHPWVFFTVLGWVWPFSWLKPIFAVLFSWLSALGNWGRGVLGSVWPWDSFWGREVLRSQWQVGLPGLGPLGPLGQGLGGKVVERVGRSVFREVVPGEWEVGFEADEVVG